MARFNGNTGVVACCHVLDGKMPIRRVCVDEQGMQVLCWGDHNSIADGRWIHLGHLLSRDPSIRQALREEDDAYVAYRSAEGMPWIFEPLAPASEGAAAPPAA